MCVESSRHRDHSNSLHVDLTQCRVQCLEILFIADIEGQGKIHTVVFRNQSCASIIRDSVQRDVRELWVSKEDLLCAVSMVPIESNVRVGSSRRLTAITMLLK